MDRSPLLESHRAHGARLGERPEAPGCVAPLSFGDVPGEYRAARTGAVLLDACDRGRVRVSGRDAVDFLHRLLANHVKPLGPGSGNANLLLSPKGKVRFGFDLARLEDGFELSTPPGRAGALAQALETFHFSESLRIEDTSGGYAPLELVGPRGAACLEALLGQAPELADHAHRSLPWEGTVLRVQALGANAWRLDAGPEHAQSLWDALRARGATPAGLVVRDSLRVEAGRALLGVDVDENVYPQEARLEAAFALDKGCYVGQEVVAKIDTYGGLNKLLLPLRVDHSDPVAAGTKLVKIEEGETRELGLVTSWGYSFALDTGLVLAYVKRQHQEPGTTFFLRTEAGEVGTGTIVAPPVP